jgi:hypothetical protein
MPGRPEYWDVKPKEFRKLKTRMSFLVVKTFESLKSYGFTKIERDNDWLGYIVKRNKGDYLTFVSFSLIKETPRKFEHLFRQWEKTNPSETSKDLYIREFDSITDFENSLDEELEIIIKILNSTVN